MSGKPQYDEPAVIDAAIEVFWRHGYAAASVSELTNATGLSRSSLYQRFGDKDGIFLEALSRYTDRVLQRMEGVRADTARARVEAILRGFLPREGKSKYTPGCLLARSCVEMANLSAAGQQAVNIGVRHQKAIIERILLAAAEHAELAKDADLEGLAWFYVGMVQAVLNLPQAGAKRSELERMIDIAMSAWPTEG
jgi:AcrR family transcriptional regulator